MDNEMLSVFLGTRVLPQWGQRSFTAENLLSSGENLALQILHRSCHLEQLFL